MRASKSPLQDPEAFGDLFSRTHIIVYRFVYGLYGGTDEEVEDITCDTYMRAWKGRQHFEGNDHDALCWLFTIARHLIIDAHRRRVAHPENSNQDIDDTSLIPGLFTDLSSPEEQVSNTEQYKRLWQILNKLPEDKRELLVFRYMLGWKVNQIAEYLGKEANTVSVSIRRSLEQIRSAWPRD